MRMAPGTLISGSCWFSSISFIIQLHVMFLTTCRVYGAFPQALNASSTFETLGFAEFQKITINDMNGEVYVGATNHILQLNEDLGFIDEQSSLVTGSTSDCTDSNILCLYPGGVNNVNSILLFDPDKNIVISCGSALNGTCLVHNATRISDVEARVNSPENRALNSLGLGRTVVSFIGSVPKTEEKGYYIGATFDETLPYPEIRQHAVSTKRLVQTNNGGWKFEYGFSNPLLSRYTYTDILKRYRETFKVDYVYGFTSGNYSYFLTVQKDGTSSSNYVTRIIRICQQDKSYYSYIEMDLICRQNTKRSKNYKLIQSAFISHAGATLASELGLDPMDEVLYGVFSNSEENTNIPTADSALCVYPLSKIASQFMKGLKRCFEAGSGTQGLLFIEIDDNRCSLVTGVEVTEDFCGTGQLHPVEMPVSTVSKDYLIGGGAEHRFTSLAVAVEAGDTIAIMGTSDGSLLKYLIEPLTVERVPRTNPSIPFKHLWLDTPGPVLKDMPFDLSQEHLYVVTAYKVYKVEVSTCAHYVDCSVCISTPDPNNCGWCGGSCSTRQECRSTGMDWTQEMCSPAIYQVSPTAVPLIGGSYVSVIGDSLGVLFGEGTHLLSLAGHPCEINQTASDLNKFVCVAPIVSSPVEGDVVAHVDVQDPAGSFHVTGNATSPPAYRFSFVDPVIKSFRPKNGPSFGGTEVTIFGNHLDAGKNQEVSVAGSPCVVKAVDDQSLSCTTTYGAEDSSGKVAITIDTYTFMSTDRYTFTKNPLITGFQPPASIVSGGIEIHVNGSSLDLVQSLDMVLNISDSTYRQICTTVSDTSATCNSPDLTSTGLIFGLDEGQSFDLTFELNGYTLPPVGAFTIYPNPIVESFKNQISVTARGTLTIQGLNFKMSSDLPEPMVYVADRVCTVTYLNNTSIYCTLPALPKQNEGDTGYYIEIRLGNFTEQVGRVLVLPRVRNPGLVVGLIFLILIVILLFMMLVYFIRMRHAKTGSYGQTAVSDLPTAENMVMFRGGTGSSDGVATITPQLPIPNTYLRQPSQMDSPEMVIGGAAASQSEASPLLERIPKDIAIQISDVLVQEDNLTLGDVLGRGHFGCVYEGRYFQDGREMHVAVKSLLRGGTNDISAFLKEGIMMKDFDHPNVLALIGVCITRDNQPLVILPYMANGDLLTYVRDGKNELTMRQLLHFCRQMAEGMTYLANLKFVHRDLAARNCMLDEDFVAKVADFGLSRDIYERDYYSGKDKTIKLPVRWMALECLERSIYNTKTDVWSFGIVMWEIITRGMNPYPLVDNWDLTSFLQRGRRLPQPEHCPDHVYQIMYSTWSASSVDRPSFKMLQQQLTDLLEEKPECPSPGSDQQDFNDTYINVPGL